MFDKRSRRSCFVSVAVLLFLVLAAPLHDLEAQPPDPSQTQHDVLETFWDRPSLWSSLELRKGLRATGESDLWSVWVDFGETGDWRHQGQLREIARLVPAEPQPLTEEMRLAFDLIEGIVIVAEVVGAGAGDTFVVGFINERPLYQDASGDTLLPFAPLHVGNSLETAVEFAEVYVDLYDGEMDSFAGDPTSSSSGVPHVHGAEGAEVQGHGENFLSEKCPCEDGCHAEFDEENLLCGIKAAACNSAVTAAFVACAVGCLGVPVCEAACGVAYLAGLALCTTDALLCRNQAEKNRRTCLIDCSV